MSTVKKDLKLISETMRRITKYMLNGECSSLEQNAIVYYRNSLDVKKMIKYEKVEFPYYCVLDKVFIVPLVIKDLKKVNIVSRIITLEPLSDLKVYDKKEMIKLCDLLNTYTRQHAS